VKRRGIRIAAELTPDQACSAAFCVKAGLMADDLQNLTKSPLSAKQKAAAVRCAEDLMTDESIAAEAGVSRQTLHNWRQREDFQDAIKAADAAMLAAALRLPIARKHHRMKVLNDLHTKALTVIDERAAELAYSAPGMDSGLVVHQTKQIGSGQYAQTIDEFAVDTGLMREIRAIQEQAAKETGDWSENLNVTGTTAVRLIGISEEDV
jgi:transposase-like protein